MSINHTCGNNRLANTAFTVIFLHFYLFNEISLSRFVLQRIFSFALNIQIRFYFHSFRIFVDYFSLSKVFYLERWMLLGELTNIRSEIVFYVKMGSSFFSFLNWQKTIHATIYFLDVTRMRTYLSACSGDAIRCLENRVRRRNFPIHFVAKYLI